MAKDNTPQQPAAPEVAAPAPKTEFKHPFADVPAGKYRFHVGNLAAGFPAEINAKGQVQFKGDKFNVTTLAQIPRNGVFVAE